MGGSTKTARAVTPSPTPTPDIKMLKRILSLNADLPEQIVTTWVTVSEMHHHLTEGGVDKVLLEDMLQYAIHRANGSKEILSRRPDGDIIFYRPCMYQHCAGTPVQQRKRSMGGRNRHLNTSPPKGYFLSNPTTSSKVANVNQALMDYRDKLIEFNSK